MQAGERVLVVRRPVRPHAGLGQARTCSAPLACLHPLQARAGDRIDAGAIPMRPRLTRLDGHELIAAAELLTGGQRRWRGAAPPRTNSPWKRGLTSKPAAKDCGITVCCEGTYPCFSGLLTEVTDQQTTSCIGARETRSGLQPARVAARAGEAHDGTDARGGLPRVPHIWSAGVSNSPSLRTKKRVDGAPIAI